MTQKELYDPLPSRPARSRQLNAAAPRYDEAHMLRVDPLLAEVQALSTRLATLNEVAVRLQSSLNEATLLQTMAQQARWILDFEYCTVVLRDAERLRLHVLHGDAPAHAQPYQPSDLIHQVLSFGYPLLMADLDPQTAPPGMRSALMLPLRDADQIIGTLNFYASKAAGYNQDDLRIAYALAVQTAAMLQNSRLFGETSRTRDELATVLESISDAVVVIDQAGRVALSNQSFRQSFTDQPIVGRSALRLLRLKASGRYLIDRLTVRSILAQQRSKIDETQHGTIHLSDGRHFEWVSAPLHGGDAPAGSVVTLRDISARVELEQMRRDLVSMVVHDLRAPLSSLAMGMELLTIDQQATPAENAALVKDLRSTVDRLLGQVNTVLDLSKLEAGRMALDLTPCLIQQLIDQVCNGLAPLAQHKHQRLVRDLPAQPPVTLVDLRILQRVLENLLGNAIKFTPHGGTITIGADHDEATRQLELWVRDQGPGVPPEQQQYIFETYAQLRDQQHLGSGLGLAFCKLAVEAHGGTIGVRDSINGGSEFWLRLPVIDYP